MNLLTSAWVETTKGILSPQEILNSNDSGCLLRSIPPISQVCIFRFLLWLDCWSREDSRWLNSSSSRFDLFSSRFLQDPLAAKAKSYRETWKILGNVDDSNLALQPEGSKFRKPKSIELPLAVLTAFMADKGGLKSTAGDSAVSAVTPNLVGNYNIFRNGDSLAGIITANREFVTRTVADQMMWPWRRLWIHENGCISIISGTNKNPPKADPFVGKRATSIPPEQRQRFEPGSKVWQESAGRECIVVALSVLKAKTLSHYCSYLKHGV